MIIEKQGDIFTTESEVLGHGCNCFGVWGGGISLQFLKKYPDMHVAYKEFCKDKKAKTSEILWYQTEDFIIANMFTQFKPGPDARYSWIVDCVGLALDACEKHGKDTFSIPRLGAGIGGLDWNQTLYLLIDSFHDHDVNLEIWSLDNADSVD